jgi:hypothetical protein
MISQYHIRMSEVASVADGVLLSWSSSLSTRGIHTVHPPLSHDPQYYVINLEGSKPDATSQNGELERIVYAPAVDAQVKEALVRVSHDK